MPNTREQVREGLLQSAITLGLEEIASTLPSWEHFADEDVLHERAMEQMLVGVSPYARRPRPR